MVSKQTPTLQQILGHGLEGVIKLAIGVNVDVDEPDPALPRRERLQFRRECFDEGVQPTLKWIEDLGGHVDTVAWSNATVYATLPKVSVDDLEVVPQIEQLDAAGFVYEESPPVT